MTDYKLIDHLNKTHPLCLEASTWLAKTPWRTGSAGSLRPVSLIRWAAMEAGLRDKRVADVAEMLALMESQWTPEQTLERLTLDEDGEENGLTLKDEESPENAAATLWETLMA